MKYSKACNIIKKAFECFFDSSVKRDTLYNDLFTREVLDAINVVDKHHTNNRDKYNKMIDKCVMYDVPVSIKSYDNWKTSSPLYEEIYDDFERASDLFTPTNVSILGELHYISDRWNAPNRVRFLKNLLLNFTKEELIALSKFKSTISDYQEFMKDLFKEQHEEAFSRNNFQYELVDVDSKIYGVLLKAAGLKKKIWHFKTRDTVSQNVESCEYIHEVQYYINGFSYGRSSHVSHKCKQQYFYTRLWIRELKSTSRFK